jgi:hypothetical protein
MNSLEKIGLLIVGFLEKKKFPRLGRRLQI